MKKLTNASITLLILTIFIHPIYGQFTMEGIVNSEVVGISSNSLAKNEC